MHPDEAGTALRALIEKQAVFHSKLFAVEQGLCTYPCPTASFESDFLRCSLAFLDTHSHFEGRQFLSGCSFRTHEPNGSVPLLQKLHFRVVGSPDASAHRVAVPD